jgi:hypothetical protein
VILVDTSVWVEFFRGIKSENTARLISEIEHGNVIACSFVFAELMQGARDEAEVKRVSDVMQWLPSADERDVAVEAGRLSFQHKLYSKGVGLLDAVILAAALRGRHELWTLDKRLEEVWRSIRV